MAVESIECQIAKSQIGRYLNGDAFSPLALQQLEAHIAECEGCKASVQQRKAALQAMLGQHVAVAEVPVTDTGNQAQVDALKAYIASHAAADVKGRQKPDGSLRKQFVKPLAYTLALALVLVGMSLYSKTLSNPFGDRIASETDSPANPSAAPKIEPEPTVTPAPPLASGSPDTNKPQSGADSMATKSKVAAAADDVASKPDSDPVPSDTKADSKPDTATAVEEPRQSASASRPNDSLTAAPARSETVRPKLRRSKHAGRSRRAVPRHRANFKKRVRSNKPSVSTIRVYDANSRPLSS